MDWRKLLLLLLLLTSIDISWADGCYECTDSSLKSGSGSNGTCNGGYCYRVETKNLKNETTIGCIDFPLQQLRSGCRRNFEGSVLCICTSNLCNEEAAVDIVDLPIVKDCRTGSELDSGLHSYMKCTSNFCSKTRIASLGLSTKEIENYSTYNCQQDENVLARFDLFVWSYPFFIPTGMCLKIQKAKDDITETCSCLHMQNCSTSTKYPGNSTLPLDGRKKGFVNCTIGDESTINGTCSGHVCFILQRSPPFFKTEYGCITYGEGFDEKRFPLGAYRAVDSNLFICAGNMCNNQSEHVVFQGLATFNESSCITTSTNPAATAATKAGTVPKTTTAPAKTTVVPAKATSPTAVTRTKRAAAAATTPAATTKAPKTKKPTTTTPAPTEPPTKMAPVLGICIPLALIILIVIALTVCKLFIRRSM